jgi:aerobic-type carbon monoxide dehydrogenase small subunit (CoxS/CutS family)
VLAAVANGHEVTTIEGITGSGETPLQKAFLEHDALQCGYCTPGQMVSATALLAEHPSPTREQILAGMSGNICRCGAYQKIVAAIEAVGTEAA